MPTIAPQPWMMPQSSRAAWQPLALRPSAEVHLEKSFCASTFLATTQSACNLAAHAYCALSLKHCVSASGSRRRRRHRPECRATGTKPKNILQYWTAIALCIDATATFVVSVLSKDDEEFDFKKESRLAPQAPVETSSIPTTKKRREMRFLLVFKRTIVERNVARNRRRHHIN